MSIITSKLGSDLRRSRNSVLLLIICCCLFATNATAQNSKIALPVVSDEVFSAISRFYDYDKNIPLEARIVHQEEIPEEKREKIVFRGCRQNLVPAYLVLPKTNADKHPVILIADGIYGSKERWFQDDSWPKGGLITKAFLKAGFAVMILDAVYHGERSCENGYSNPPWLFTYPNTARQMIMQTTVEYRLAIDYLTSRNDIDTSRIGMLGLSMGGLISFELTAVDDRVKTAVTGVTPIIRETEYQAVTPSTFASRNKCQSFLMFMGEQDHFYTMEEANLLYDMIPTTNKKIVSYKSGHEPPIKYVDMATNWFKKNLLSE